MSSTRDALDDAGELDATTTAAGDRFDAMVARLSKLSVDKHFDAYVDVSWDDPEMTIDPTDPRWPPPTGIPWSSVLPPWPARSPPITCSAFSSRLATHTR